MYHIHFLFSYKKPSFVSDLHGRFSLTFSHVHVFFLFKMSSLNVSVNLGLFKNERTFYRIEKESFVFI